jgi:RNA polymerase sigma-70 factor (ECF subfamily)
MPDDARDDARLVRAAGRGEEDAFRALVQRYAAKVAAVCFSVTGEAEVSRDLVQEVFTEAFLSLRRLRSPAKLAPWLASVARLKAVSWVRHRVRHREERGRGGAEFLAAGRASPGDDVEREELRRRVLAAVRGLPPAYREVIVLRCLEEEPPSEVCRMLGISLSAMDKRLSRAKNMLREALGDLVDGASEGVDRRKEETKAGRREAHKEAEGGKAAAARWEREDAEARRVP